SALMESATGLSVTTSRAGRATIVHLRGDAGVGSVDTLSRQLLPITAQRPPLVVFELSGVTFIASLGLGEMMQFQRGLKRHGGEVRLVGLQPVVRDMITKCRLDSVLIMADSLDDALAALPAE